MPFRTHTYRFLTSTVSALALLVFAMSAWAEVVPQARSP